MSYKQYKSAARDLISYVYNHGYKIRIDVGWDSPDYFYPATAKEAWEEVNAVDGGEDFSIVTGDKAGDKWVGAVILAIGYNDPEEEVCDFTDVKFINDWFDGYFDRY
jgi:hypothetical protein